MSKPSADPVPADLLKAGTSAEDIRCIDCGDRWDGSTPFAPACCPTCRDIADQLARAWVESALAPTAAKRTAA